MENYAAIDVGSNQVLIFIVSLDNGKIRDRVLDRGEITKLGEDTIHKKNENYDYRDIRFFGKCGITLNEKANIELHTRYFNSDLGFGRTRKILPDSVDIVTKGEKFTIVPMTTFTFNDNITVAGRFRDDFLGF